MPKIDAVQSPSTADYNLIDLFSITSFIKKPKSSAASFLLRIEFSTFESIDRFMVDSPIGVPRELVGLIKIFIRKTSPRGDIYRNLWHTFLGVYCYILIINFYLVRLVFFCFLLFYFMKIGCLNNVISVSCLISTVALIESPGREEFVVKHGKLVYSSSSNRIFDSGAASRRSVGL